MAEKFSAWTVVRSSLWAKSTGRDRLGEVASLSAPSSFPSRARHRRRASRACRCPRHRWLRRRHDPCLGRSSSTTLLIASAILLLFAAVGLDWNEILASWGSASVSLRRGLEHVDEGLELGEAGLEEVAAREEAEPVREELGVLRDQLEILRGQVRGLTSPPTPFSRFSIRTSSVSPLMESLLRGGTASHELQDNSVRLSLRSGSPHLGLPMHCQNAEWQQLQRRDNSTC